MTLDNISSSADCEIITTRIVNTSKEIAFTAWTDPNHLKKWWGPAGFTNTFNVFDFRVGGKWDFIMHGPDKGNYHNECEFIKIEKHALIAWKRISKPIFQVVVTFEDIAVNKTKIVFKMIFNKKEECSKIKKFVVDKNEENFDKLENELAKMTS